MSTDAPDLNLLRTLDALLEHESVSVAARKLRITPPAMSRALARIRATTGDPILTRAGRVLVPTPRAVALREEVRAALAQADALLTSVRARDVESEKRTFVIRSNEIFAATLGAPLATALAKRMPRATLSFVAEGDESVDDLRTGGVDLDIGVPSSDGPELRMRTLFRDRVVGVVRRDHPLARVRTVSAAAFIRHDHVVCVRAGKSNALIDARLRALGLERRVRLVVPSHVAVLFAASDANLVGIVAERAVEHFADHVPIVAIRLPFETPMLTIAATWHPRLEVDLAHRALRESLFEVAANALREADRRRMRQRHDATLVG